MQDAFENLISLQGVSEQVTRLGAVIDKLKGNPALKMRYRNFAKSLARDLREAQSAGHSITTAAATN